MKKILITILMLVALPVSTLSASTNQGILTGCVVVPFESDQEMMQKMDYAYTLLNALESLNNPEWSNTLISIREQLDCLEMSFMD